MTLLRFELTQIIAKLNRTNMHVAEWAMAPVWGGSTQMNMYLRALEDLVLFKNEKEWNWDFVVNLSESDFPIK